MNTDHNLLPNFAYSGQHKPYLHSYFILMCTNGRIFLSTQKTQGPSVHVASPDQFIHKNWGYITYLSLAELALAFEVMVSFSKAFH